MATIRITKEKVSNSGPRKAQVYVQHSQMPLAKNDYRYREKLVMKQSTKMKCSREMTVAVKSQKRKAKTIIISFLTWPRH